MTSNTKGSGIRIKSGSRIDTDKMVQPMKTTTNIWFKPQAMAEIEISPKDVWICPIITWKTVLTSLILKKMKDRAVCGGKHP